MIQEENRVVRITNIVVTAAAYIAGFVLLALMLLTTADVLGRYFFNLPLTGVFDLTHFAVLIMTFLGLPYCGFQGGHIVIELLYKRLKPATARMLLRLVNLVGCILFLVIAWRAVVQSLDVREFEEASQLLMIPYYPFYWVLAFGSVLFAWVMALHVFVFEPEKENEK